MRRKRAATIAAIIALLLTGAVLALSRGLDVNRYRGRVQAALAERLDREVSLGRMHLRLVPLGLRVEDAAIADDPGFQTGSPFVRAEELYVTPRLLPLLRGRFELRSLELRRPVIELLRNAAGIWNFTTLGRDEKPEPRLVLHRLVITNGQVAVTDLQKGQGLVASETAGEGGRTVYEDIDLRLDDYAPGRTFDIVLTATLPGTGTQRLSVRGTAGPLVRDHVATTPFDGAVQFDEVSLSGLQRFLKLEALERTDSVISGSTDLSNQDGRLSSKGSLRLEHTSARGVSLGYPITAAFDVAYDASTELLTVKSGTFRLDETPLSFAGTVNLQPETPTVNVHVTASDVSLAEAARLASAFGVAFGENTRVEGRMNADVRARGPANRPALDGRLQARDVSISGPDIPRPVRTQAVDLTLTPNEIRSNDFSASTNSTSLGVRFALRDYTTPSPAIDASVRTTGADVGEVLNVARAWGIHAAEGVSGTGRLTLNVRASGPTDAPTYSGSGSINDATLKTPSIAQPLRLRKASITFSGNAAVVESLAASIGKTSAEGSLTVRNFADPQVEFQLSADAIDVAEMQDILLPARNLPRPQERRAKESVLLRTTGSGRMRVGSVTYGHLVLDNVQANATLDRGLIRLDPLTAGLFGGRHRGSVMVDARRTPAAFTVASDLEQVDANRLASAVTNLRDVIYGALASVVRVNFSTDGTGNIAPSLNGTLSLNIPDGRIAKMDVLHEVAAIARFVTGETGDQRSTRVTTLRGNFTVTRGVAHTDDLTASIEGGALHASGSINLVDQGLNLRTTTVLSSDFSRRVGGTRVGGFMATVLANREGELVVPMIVTGTLQQPRFAPDVQRVAEMKLRNLVPSLRSPQRLTSELLGAIGEYQATPKPERKDPAQQLQEALRELLGGREQQEEKPPSK